MVASSTLIVAALFLILFSWAGVFVAGLGFLEPWARLRERFAKQQQPGTDTEEE